MDSDLISLLKQEMDLLMDNLKSLKDMNLEALSVPRRSRQDNQSKVTKNLDNHNIPLLLVPSKRSKSRTWSIYSILENKFLESKLLIPWHRRQFCGSSDGWLATIDEKLVITLYKPSMVNEDKSDAIIHLPPLVSPEWKDAEAIIDDPLFQIDDYILKVTIFTPDPIASPNDIICAAIFGEFCDLAYIRPTRNSSWTHIVTGTERVIFEDVVYYNDQFFALTYDGKVASFDVVDQAFKSTIKSVADETPGCDGKRYFCYKKYLVEANGGELWQVHKYVASYPDGNPVTEKFEVFKLSFDGPRWIEITDLGDVALFLGDNSSISVVASKFGCEGSCIYFTQDKNAFCLGRHGPRDLGVYDLKTGSLEPRFTLDESIFAKMRRRLIWVVPGLSTC